VTETGGGEHPGGPEKWLAGCADTTTVSRVPVLGARRIL